ncbi:glycosyltransferase family 39 protein [Defluviimonas aestuarii]|uniref:ArnT family glycosyltransferase n=1 Tax=Albidovulum aestuarii TaxID=1130726 RepID=UPI00249AC2B2|nr:glycosyltransferase family 39 protein [Defluviimonas aestuarii]MDI3338509.1 glycosyltransferase family 39 protein [Defluviimonas aestuarii]
MADRADWLPRAALVVGAVTLARLVALWFNKTDLFVDESQYWLWGERLDFGYYSKPPLIAWVIRAVTELAGSDAPFWVRLPGAIFHGATALILGAVSARLFSGRAAFWTAITYATLPMVALGSVLISTDTIMAPFFATALLFHIRAAETGRVVFAAVAGFCLGLAFLAKYAAVYFLIGVALAAVFVPALRPGLRVWATMLIAFVVAILPNVLWNLSNDLTTVAHTVDNAGWVQHASWFANLNPSGLAEFFFSQFAVVGPVIFAALLFGYVRPGSVEGRGLALFSLPVVVIVCVQAFLAQAYANWGVAAYFAGTVLAVAVLLDRAPRLLPWSLAINGALSVLLPVLTVIAPVPERGGEPLLARYLGRVDLSRQIIDAAGVAGATSIVAGDRDILADLFHTGKGSGLTFYAPTPKDRPRSYYEQTFPLPADAAGVLLVAGDAPACAGAPVAEFDTGNGAHAGLALRAWLLPKGCRDAGN